MNEPIEITTTSAAPRRCLAPGCPCADGRIVSHRHASFIAALARRNGQTSDRVIAPEPGWAIPGEPTR